MSTRAAFRFVTYLGIASLAMAMWCALAFVLWHFDLQPRNVDMIGFAFGFLALGSFLSALGERLWNGLAVRLEDDDAGDDDAEVTIASTEADAASSDPHK